MVSGVPSLQKLSYLVQSWKEVQIVVPVEKKVIEQVS